jgi:hypothetical protein
VANGQRSNNSVRAEPAGGRAEAVAAANKEAAGAGGRVEPSIAEPGRAEPGRAGPGQAQELTSNACG